ncbi:MAG: pectinesterase family protein [Bacteroidia bacterium]|nr:pectinesterase family protein [Bacteroidia bacterium]
MKIFFTTFILLAIACYAFSTTVIVDQYGGGTFTSIQTAIQNSSAGDTIKVWPGTYTEQITLNKNLVLMGSGYENTILTGSFNPTIAMSTGKFMWFMVSSLVGNGINISGGTVTNCVIIGCAVHGIYRPNGIAYIINCVLTQNGGSGIYSAHLNDGSMLYVVNTISRSNSGLGFDGPSECCWHQEINVQYSNGNYDVPLGGQGLINTDPYFTSSSDYHISQGSPCWDTGNPSIQDPDGTPSDMGYFGGTDCPIYPVVYKITLTPNGGNVNIQAKGRANY